MDGLPRGGSFQEIKGVHNYVLDDQVVCKYAWTSLGILIDTVTC